MIIAREKSKAFLERALHTWMESQKGEEEVPSPDRIPLASVKGQKITALAPGLVSLGADGSVWRIEGGELVRDETLTFEAGVASAWEEDEDAPEIGS